MQQQCPDHALGDVRGAAMIFFAVTIVALLSLVALAVDLEMAVRSRNIAQAAGDIAALAAVRLHRSGASASEVEDAARQLVRANLKAAGVSDEEINNRRMTQLSVNFSEESGTASVHISQNASQPYFFAKIFPALGNAMPVRAESAAAYSAPALSSPNPIHVILLIDTSMTMAVASAYGDGCNYLDTNILDACYMFNQNCPASCYSSAKAARMFADQLISSLSPSDTVSLARVEDQHAFLEKFVSADNAGKIQLKNAVAALPNGVAQADFAVAGFAAYDLAGQITDFSKPIAVVYITNGQQTYAEPPSEVWPLDTDIVTAIDHGMQARQAEYIDSPPVEAADDCRRRTPACEEQRMDCLLHPPQPSPQCATQNLARWWNDRDGRCEVVQSACFQTYQECVRNSPTLCEQYANTLFHSMQDIARSHDDAARIYTVAVTDMRAAGNPAYFDWWRTDHLMNALMDLADDRSQSRRDVANSLDCGGPRPEEMAGLFFKVWPDPSEIQGQVAKLLRHARRGLQVGSAGGNSDEPHLIAAE
jgi:Flp pilus assembly protein TadG